MGLNVTNNVTTDEKALWYYSHQEIFWILISISILIALAGVVGNALVIFAATQKRSIGAGFRYLNHAVISLAIADFILSLFGTPFSIVYWYWGEKCILFKFIQRSSTVYKSS